MPKFFYLRPKLLYLKSYLVQEKPHALSLLELFNLWVFMTSIQLFDLL